MDNFEKLSRKKVEGKTVRLPAGEPSVDDPVMTELLEDCNQAVMAVEEPLYSRKEVVVAVKTLLESVSHPMDDATLEAMKAVVSVLPTEWRRDIPDLGCCFSAVSFQQIHCNKIDLQKTLLTLYYNLVLLNQGKVSLEDQEEGFRGCEGRVESRSFSHGAFLKMQINDPEGRLAPGGRWNFLGQSLMKTVEEMRKTSSLIKIYVDVSENVLVISMDPGKHKEYLIVSAAAGEIQLFHRHVKSSHERAVANSPREEYVQEVTGGWGNTVFTNSNKYLDTAVSAPWSVMVCRFREAMRLTRSVKDMDLSFHDAGLLHTLFSKGVTNLDSFLLLMSRDEKEEPAGVLEEVLNADEQILLDQYRVFVAQRKEIVEDMKSVIDWQQEALKINYEILEKMTVLQQMAYKLQTVEVGTGVKGLKFRDIFEQMTTKLRELAAMVRDDGLVSDIIAAYELVVDQMDLLASGETLPDSPKVFRDFKAMFLGKTGLPVLDRKMSLQELLRYCHYKVHVQTQAYLSHGMLPLSGWDGPSADGFVAVDLTAKKNIKENALWQVFNGLLRKAYLPKELTSGKFSNKRASLWVSEQSAGLTLPTGKRFIEILTCSSISEHSIIIKYVDSSYTGGGKRCSMVDEELAGLGFDVYRKGLVVESRFQSSSPEAWRTALESSLRLMVGVRNLDLKPERIETARRLFREGVTNLIEGVYHSEMVGSDEMSVARVFQTLYNDPAEQKFLIRSIVERGLTKKQMLADLDGQPVIIWEKMIDALIALEEEAKARKNKAAQGRYNRLAATLCREMDKRKL